MTESDCSWERLEAATVKYAVAGAGTALVRAQHLLAHDMWLTFLTRYNRMALNIADPNVLDHTMSMFLQYLLLDLHKSPGRALALGSSVSAYLQVSGIPSPASSPRTKMQRLALRRACPPPKRANAFNSETFYAVALGELASAAVDNVHLTVAFFLGFSAVLRGSEYACPDNRVDEWIAVRGLRNSDIVFERDPDGVTVVVITIRFRKQDQAGVGHRVRLRGSSAGDSRLDVVKLLQHIHCPHNPHDLLLYEWGPNTGSRPLRTSTVGRRLRERLQALNLAYTGFTPHSLRASGCTALARTQRYTESEIARFGGWFSTAALIYIRSLLIESRDPIADIYHHTFAHALPDE